MDGILNPDEYEDPALLPHNGARCASGSTRIWSPERLRSRPLSAASMGGTGEGATHWKPAAAAVGVDDGEERHVTGKATLRVTARTSSVPPRPVTPQQQLDLDFASRTSPHGSPNRRHAYHRCVVRPSTPTYRGARGLTPTVGRRIGPRPSSAASVLAGDRRPASSGGQGPAQPSAERDAVVGETSHFVLSADPAMRLRHIGGPRHQLPAGYDYDVPREYVAGSPDAGTAAAAPQPRGEKQTTKRSTAHSSPPPSLDVFQVGLDASADGDALCGWSSSTAAVTTAASPPLVAVAGSPPRLHPPPAASAAGGAASSSGTSTNSNVVVGITTLESVAATTAAAAASRIVAATPTSGDGAALLTAMLGRAAVALRSPRANAVAGSGGGRRKLAMSPEKKQLRQRRAEAATATLAGLTTQHDERIAAAEAQRRITGPGQPLLRDEWRARQQQQGQQEQQQGHRQETGQQDAPHHHHHPGGQGRPNAAAAAAAVCSHRLPAAYDALKLFNTGMVSNTLRGGIRRVTSVAGHLRVPGAVAAAFPAPVAFVELFLRPQCFAGTHHLSPVITTDGDHQRVQAAVDALVAALDDRALGSDWEPVLDCSRERVIVRFHCTDALRGLHSVGKFVALVRRGTCATFAGLFEPVASPVASVSSATTMLSEAPRLLKDDALVAAEEAFVQGTLDDEQRRIEARKMKVRVNVVDDAEGGGRRKSQMSLSQRRAAAKADEAMQGHAMLDDVLSGGGGVFGEGAREGATGSGQDDDDDDTTSDSDDDFAGKSLNLGAESLRPLVQQLCPAAQQAFDDWAARRVDIRKHAVVVSVGAFDGGSGIFPLPHADAAGRRLVDRLDDLGYTVDWMRVDPATTQKPDHADHFLYPTLPNVLSVIGHLLENTYAESTSLAIFFVTRGLHLPEKKRHPVVNEARNLLPGGSRVVFLADSNPSRLNPTTTLTVEALTSLTDHYGVPPFLLVDTWPIYASPFVTGSAGVHPQSFVCVNGREGVGSTVLATYPPPPPPASSPSATGASPKRRARAAAASKGFAAAARSKFGPTAGGGVAVRHFLKLLDGAGFPGGAQVAVGGASGPNSFAVRGAQWTTYAVVARLVEKLGALGCSIVTNADGIGAADTHCYADVGAHLVARWQPSSPAHEQQRAAAFDVDALARIATDMALATSLQQLRKPSSALALSPTDATSRLRRRSSANNNNNQQVVRRRSSSAAMLHSSGRRASSAASLHGSPGPPGRRDSSSAGAAAGLFRRHKSAVAPATVGSASTVQLDDVIKAGRREYTGPETVDSAAGAGGFATLQLLVRVDAQSRLPSPLPANASTAPIGVGSRAAHAHTHSGGPFLRKLFALLAAAAKVVEKKDDDADERPCCAYGSGLIDWSTLFCLYTPSAVASALSDTAARQRLDADARAVRDHACGAATRLYGGGMSSSSGVVSAARIHRVTAGTPCGSFPAGGMTTVPCATWATAAATLDALHCGRVKAVRCQPSAVFVRCAITVHHATGHTLHKLRRLVDGQLLFPQLVLFESVEWHACQDPDRHQAAAKLQATLRMRLARKCYAAHQRIACLEAETRRGLVQPHEMWVVSTGKEFRKQHRFAVESEETRRRRDLLSHEGGERVHLIRLRIALLNDEETRHRQLAVEACFNASLVNYASMWRRVGTIVCWHQLTRSAHELHRLGLQEAWRRYHDVELEWFRGVLDIRNTLRGGSNIRANSNNNAAAVLANTHVWRPTPPSTAFEAAADDDESTTAVASSSGAAAVLDRPVVLVPSLVDNLLS